LIEFCLVDHGHPPRDLDFGALGAIAELAEASRAVSVALAAADW